MQIKTISFGFAAVLAFGGAASAAPPSGKGFPSPEAAAQALLAAAKTEDPAGLVELLGPSSKPILVTKDPVADQRALKRFAARAAEKMKVVNDPREPGAKTLLVGKNDWPLPFPIVQVNGLWYFDVAKGKQEILNRRIGGNELDAIEVCRGYVEAQEDYAQRNRTGSNAAAYAQRIISTPGQRDGLFWPANGAAETSPMGSLIAKAFAEGYRNKKDPYHGYYFKVLTAQGPHASGGAMSYVADGVMTKGFALIAWPSDYGSTGIMTFLVDKTGIVYQKNLGSATGKLASEYTAYDPDTTWTPVAATPNP